MTYIVGETGHGSFARQLAEKIVNEIGGTFPKLRDRLSIWDDVEKYNWKEDESIWKQKKGMLPGEGEVYMDNQFICAYAQRDGVNSAYIRFLRELNNLYIQGKIYVNPEIYMIKAEEERLRREKDILEIPEARNEGEQMIVDIIETHAKKRKRKTKIKK